ncbi:MAG: D-inositol-3-phosphate glycosyltransferase [Nitrosomonadaceae bacterium]|nr:D-inositol-3-phosphate glycosyltransferase [Nitrosomonadaceae bacterium]
METQAPPKPIYVGFCILHGRDYSSTLASQSYERIITHQFDYDGRPVYFLKFVMMGDEYARGRNGVLEQVVQAEQNEGIHIDYLFWLDDDIVAPPTCIQTLMEKNVPIASGLYFMRKEPHLPVAYYTSGDPDLKNKFWNIDSYLDNTTVEVDAVGQGCVLIKREVYNAMKRPYYAWWPVDRTPEQIITLLEGSMQQPAVLSIDDNTLGEDLYFFTRCRQLGYKIMLDTSVKCGHVGQYVFDETIYKFAQASYHKIPPAGKKSILFIAAQSPKPFDYNTLSLEGLGGSESAVAYLANAIANKHSHIVYVVSGAAPNVINRVHYRPYEHLSVLAAQPWDVVIVSRWVDVLEQIAWNKNIKSLIFWAHDMMHPSRVYEASRFSEGFVMLSPFHQASTIDPEIIARLESEGKNHSVPHIIPNGVDTSLFEGEEERDPNKLIWTSNPNRGLALAVKHFREIRKVFPKMELHVYGRASVYGWGNNEEDAFLPDADEPNVFLHDPLPKDKLARELMTAHAFFYPTYWPETFCISALEAQAAGTPVITNPYGALVDTVKGGVFAWDFVAAVKELQDPEKWELASLRGKDFANLLDWNNVSDMWMDFIETLENTDGKA